MQPSSISDIHFHDATAPPPSEYDPTDDDNQSWPAPQNPHTLQLQSLSHTPNDAVAYGKAIVRLAQDAVRHIAAKQTVQTPQPSLTPAQYCNKLGFPIKARLFPVLTALDESRLHLRILISQDDTLSSIKKQILNHSPIFDCKGYPTWSKDILGPGRKYENHSWCHLLFRGALASAQQSIRADSMHQFTAYTEIQHALDIRAIEDLHDYIQVLKSLDQLHERVERYGMGSTEYQVTIRSGFNGRDWHTLTAGPEGCRMSQPGENTFEGNGTTVSEIVVSPPPASGIHLPRRPQIVKLKVAKEVVASKFQDLQLRDIEDLGLHKLENNDLKLLLNTQRFANGAELLAQKFYVGNHVTDGLMSNLARYWLLGDAKGNENAFKHLLLLPERTSIDLVTVVMTAADLATSDQVRLLCWSISAKEDIWVCCEAVATVSVPSGIVARARLCIACLEPAVLGAVRTATYIYRKGTAKNEPKFGRQSSEELKALLRFAETDTCRKMLTAYLRLKEIGSTSHSATLLAEQIVNDPKERKLEELIQHLQHSRMRRQIVDASRSLQDLDHYVRMLNGEELSRETWTALLVRLLSTAGYRSIAELHVPIESGREQQNVTVWMSSGPSEGVCMFGQLYVLDSLEDRYPAPVRDDALLQALAGRARLDSGGRWEFSLGFKTEKRTVPTTFWDSIFAGPTTRKTEVWKHILDIDSTQRSHAHLSEQVYFYMNESELPNAQGLSLVRLERDGIGDLVGRGLSITPRIAKDIWRLGGDIYYSISNGRLWKIETEGGSHYAEQVEKLVGNFIVTSRGGSLNKTIS